MLKCILSFVSVYYCINEKVLGVFFFVFFNGQMLFRKSLQLCKEQNPQSTGWNV